MRALGPGSVSSFLKIILDVVFVALWIGVAAVSLMTLAAVLFSFNPELIDNISIRTGGAEIASRQARAAGRTGRGWPLSGRVLVIVERLRKIFADPTAGDPFHPENVRRLRVIGLVLAGPGDRPLS